MRASPNNLGDRLGDIDDLPQKLRSQLAKKTSVIEQVRSALKSLDGVASTDELLVTVYRQTGRVFSSRRSFESSLYNAEKRGRIGLVRLKDGRSNRKSGVASKAWSLAPTVKP